MTAARTCAALALALAAGCGVLGGGADAPWNTMPTTDSHSRDFFPILASTAHGTARCEDCHSPQGPSFQQFECTGCHGDAATTPLHAGVTGYQWASSACYGCHPQGTAEFANHAAIFPIRGTGVAHASVTCASCHLDPTTRTRVDCATCHLQRAVASKHGAVADYGTHADTAGCLRCHADAQVNRVAAHSRFPISAGGRHDTLCVTCHPGFRADKAWGADFTGSLSCYVAGCHDVNQVAAQQQHRGRAGFVAGDSFACYRCHPAGQGGN